MKQIKITIEEHLSKTITIYLPDNLTPDERLNQAIDKITTLYKDQQIILDSIDYNGTTLIQATDIESNTKTSWIQL